MKILTASKSVSKSLTPMDDDDQPGRSAGHKQGESGTK
jgi:hypothetical protein